MSSETIYLDLLGSRFAIETDDGQWTDFLRQLWEPFSTGTAGGESIRIAREDDRWVLETSGGPIAADASPWIIADQLRHVLVDRALSEPGDFLDLHSAVVARDGGCVLIVGGSRAGKTMLTLALVEDGWRLMSDDVALIHMVTGRVHAFPKPLAIRDVDLWLKYADRWRPPTWERTQRGGLLLPAATLGPLAGATEAPVSMVFSRFDDEHAHTRRSISAADAVARCGQYVRNVTGPRLNVLKRMCTGVDIREITYRSSVEGVAAIDEAFFDHREKMGS